MVIIDTRQLPDLLNDYEHKEEQGGFKEKIKNIGMFVKSKINY